MFEKQVKRKNLEGGEYLADDAAVAVELAVVALSISLSVGALPVATDKKHMLDKCKCVQSIFSLLCSIFIMMIRTHFQDPP